MKEYNTVKGQISGEIIIKKSRFIGNICQVDSEEAAKEIIIKMKKNYRDARHYCFAYIIEGQQQLERYGDDGEPAGTAGMPILEVLRGRKLSNVIVVVTRYFGGTKLGTGGLVRAYTKATQEVVEGSEIVVKGQYDLLQLNIPYTLSGQMDHYIQKEQIILKEVVYNEQVNYLIYCAVEKTAELIKRFIETTNNQCTVEKKRQVIGYIEKRQMIVEKIGGDDGTVG